MILFRADWTDALFIHFRVKAHELQPAVPFPLDTIGDDAFISLVAFTQRNLRPARGGKIAALLSLPLMEHPFLNLRACVRVNGEAAVYFISEWIPNRLAVLIGPRLYGLPYRYGSLEYWREESCMRGRVTAPGGMLAYRASLAADTGRKSQDDFFLERYVAVTERDGIARMFRVHHAPWPQSVAQVEILESSLLRSMGDWARTAELIGATYSPGVHDVAISRPSRCAPPIVHHSTA